ncbi:mitochondrial distribution and morphology protein 34 [Cryptococcus depauperatus CBS 7841]|uniref:Mitochondrial distribution and morphology protein 34 n=1 Tax=Cryptococcus depauperatus CBS 7841 TaxID=1295531 RepID=A0A1E3IR20_9TREE|nr:mitochondrial distribution and morphology protein 34 [Cryptococcus depauperatus CBS 7841]
MSFVFPSWSTAFSPEFHEDAKKMLEGALNKGNKPPVIQGRIEVVELHMGEQPPTLTLLEIGDLSLDRFRGILRLGYQGDAWLEVRCRVQANPLSHNPHLISSTLPLSSPLLASQPLLVPMNLRLSKLHLRAILILVVSASKGITLVFKNDPLQNVDVSSTFDSVEVIRGYLQQEIEGQLREMFREDLPGIIHRLSQRWFTGSGVGGRVEMPYREGAPTLSYGLNEYAPKEGEAGDEQEENQEIFPPYTPSKANHMPQGVAQRTPRRTSLAKANTRRLSNIISESPTSYTTFPDIEDYDPTYGLRPEGVPTHSGYEAFGRLWEKAREGEGRGLGSLIGMGEEDDDGSLAPDEDDVSDRDWENGDYQKGLDMAEMDLALRSIPLSRYKSPTRSSRHSSGMSTPAVYQGEQIEWETFPAVGGGFITKPRVFHAQSQIRAPSEAGGTVPSPSATATGGSVTARASSVGGASSTLGSLRMRPLHSVSSITSPDIFTSNGPSGLHRMVISHSDILVGAATNRVHLPRHGSFSALPPTNYTISRSNVPRLHAPTTSSSAARTSGSSWGETDGPSRSTTLSTMATSQYPSSKPSAASKTRPISVPQYCAPYEREHSVSVTGTSPRNVGSFPPRQIGLRGITLPLNNSVSQLATLSHSAHTLSPYARGHEHIAVRSFPYLSKASTASGPGSGADSLTGSNGDMDIKAKRKRIFKVGKAKNIVEEAERVTSKQAELI